MLHKLQTSNITIFGGEKEPVTKTFFIALYHYYLEILRMAISAAGPRSGGGAGGLMKSKNSKPEEIRKSNIQAAKALSDAVRTSLGPRGMDKMIQVIKAGLPGFWVEP